MENERMANGEKLTDDEMTVLDLLAAAWEGFNSLPLQHQWERQEFMHAIHNAQRLVMARPVARTNPMFNIVHGADIQTDTNRPDWADNTKWIIDDDHP